MKKLFLTPAIITLSFISLNTLAQNKPTEAKSTPVVPQYSKVVVVPLEDYQNLVGALNQLRSLTVYQPGSTSDKKVQQQQEIDAYLQELPRRVRLDSVKVDTKPTK